MDPSNEQKEGTLKETLKPFLVIGIVAERPPCIERRTATTSVRPEVGL